VKRKSDRNHFTQSTSPVETRICLYQRVFP
jgi:hypothetical protein